MVNDDFKQKNVILFIAALIFLIINLGLIYNNRQVKIRSEAVITYLNQKDEQFRISCLRDFEINPTIKYVSLDIDENEKYSFENKFVFIYSFSDIDCEKCIGDNILLLKENILASNIDVIFFPVIEMSRDAKLKMKAELHGLKYILLDKKEAVLPMNNGKEVGFFAILTPEGELINIFIPDGSFHAKTKYYFDFIKEKYF